MECTRTCGWTRSARDDADHGGFIRVQAGVHEGACGVLHAAVVACLPMVGTGAAGGGGRGSGKRASLPTRKEASHLVGMMELWGCRSSLSKCGQWRDRDEIWGGGHASSDLVTISGAEGMRSRHDLVTMGRGACEQRSGGDRAAGVPRNSGRRARRHLHTQARGRAGA